MWFWKWLLLLFYRNSLSTHFVLWHLVDTGQEKLGHRYIDYSFRSSNSLIEKEIGMSTQRIWTVWTVIRVLREATDSGSGCSEEDRMTSAWKGSKEVSGRGWPHSMGTGAPERHRKVMERHGTVTRVLEGVVAYTEISIIYEIWSLSTS